MRSLLTKSPLLALVMLSMACGDDPPPAEPEYPGNPGAITLETGQRGLPLELNRSYPANRTKYELHNEDVSALFVYGQIHSEYIAATEANGPAEFQDYLDELFEDFDDQVALYDTHYIVADLQRLDREWILDWIGGSRDEPENRVEYLYFGHPERQTDYWDDVEERLVQVANQFQPEAIIVGAEMNLYYSQNVDDWDDYVAFYWTVYDAIKDASPSTRVSAGVNWAYFMESQIAGFAQEGESDSGLLAMRRAYRAIIDPLVNRYDGEGNNIGQSDFAAIAMVPDPAAHGGTPSNVPDSFFGGLRDVYGSSIPVVIFQLGWPVSGAGSSAPSQFFSHFLEHAGGFTLEAVSWYGLSHLISGDCDPLTGPAIGAPQTICFRGMFSQSGAATALSDIYFGVDEEE